MKKTNWIKDRLNAHLDIVSKLKAVQHELDYVKKSYGNLKSPAITGMPRSNSLNCDSSLHEITQKDKEIKKLQKKINNLQNAVDTDWLEISKYIEQLKPIEELIITLHYHRGAEWDEVCKNVYGKREDYVTNKEKYKHNLFATCRRALLSLLKQKETGRL